MKSTNEPFRQLYLIIGEDDHARRRHVAALQEDLAAAGGGECERLIFDARDASWTEIGEAVETTPLFAVPRLVWVQHVDRARADLLDYLAESLPPKAPQTVVVLSAASIDRRTKAARALVQKGTLIRADPPGSRDMPAWIRERASRLGLRLSPRAAAMLHALVGDQTSALETELEKLALGVQPGETIEPSHVDTLVSRALPWAGEYAVFELVDAVVEGRRDEAFALLQQLRSTGKPPLLLLSMLARQYRLLTAACGRPGMTANELAREMEIRPFPARKVIAQARSVTLEQAIAGLEAILEADTRMKTSSGDEQLILEMLIGRLMASGARGGMSRAR